MYNHIANDSSEYGTFEGRYTSERTKPWRPTLPPRSTSFSTSTTASLPSSPKRWTRSTTPRQTSSISHACTEASRTSIRTRFRPPSGAFVTPGGARRHSATSSRTSKCVCSSQTSIYPPTTRPRISTRGAISFLSNKKSGQTQAGFL